MLLNKPMLTKETNLSVASIGGKTLVHFKILSLIIQFKIVKLQFKITIIKIIYDQYLECNKQKFPFLILLVSEIMFYITVQAHK